MQLFAAFESDTSQQKELESMKLLPQLRTFGDLSLAREIEDLSHVLEQRELEFDSVLIKAGDACTDGLYLLVEGRLDIFVPPGDPKREDGYWKKALPGSMVGEVAFFLDTRRTATVVNSANNRVCLLPKRDEVLNFLRSSCPKFLMCMHQQLYSYAETDRGIREKVLFLRNSVPYFKDVEEKALVEIAF